MLNNCNLPFKLIVSVNVYKQLTAYVQAMAQTPNVTYLLAARKQGLCYDYSTIRDGCGDAESGLRILA